MSFSVIKHLGLLPVLIVYEILTNKFDYIPTAVTVV